MVHDHRAFHGLIANLYALWLWYEFYDILYINEGLRSYSTGRSNIIVPNIIVPTTSLSHRLTSSPEPLGNENSSCIPQPHHTHFVCCITTVVPKFLHLPLSAPSLFHGSRGARKSLYHVHNAILRHDLNACYQHVTCAWRNVRNVRARMASSKFSCPLSVAQTAFTAPELSPS